jgi:phospholipid/cholesterol/gamma-HCH transport system substrate-binding protein
MNRARVELVVGSFVISAAALLLWGTVQIGGLSGVFEADGRRMSARFDDVTGLAPETPVMVAGVAVGRVQSIGLEGRRARVVLRIEDPSIQLPADSQVSIRSHGLLGERVIEIRLGDSNEQLTSGGIFTQTREAPDLDTLMSDVGGVARDAREVTTSFRNVFGGAAGEEALQEVVGNVRGMTSQLRGIVADNAQGIDRVIKNLDSFSDEINQLTAGNQDAVRDLMSNLKGASAKLNTTLDDLSAISARVERGEGTVGKLLTDDKLYDELDRTITDARETLREVRRAAEEAQEQLPATVLATLFGSLF